MSRSSGANKLCPWIENVILSYNDGTEQQTHRKLKAHVVGVGDMSQSQAQTAQQGTTELIFLSDGVVQIPAVLTAPAWEDLQDREDRDCSSGLVDATVRVLSCHLVFHMHPQVNRCRFFLSVDKLATVAAGPRKEHPPPCTALFSVRQRICKTWRLARRRQSCLSAGSQNSQLLLCGFDLSQLLGTWDKDTLHDVQADVLKALGTSPCNPPTSWEADRVTAAEPFVIPVCHLLIPEEEARQPQASSSETQSGILHRPDDRIADVPSTRVVPMIPVAEKLPILPKIPVSAVQPSAGEPEIVARGSPPGSEDTLPQDHTLLDKDETAGLRDKASPKSRSNPWDAFPPPGSSPCSDGSIAPPPEAVPPETLTDGGVPFPLATSTQVSSSSSKGSSDISQTSEQSKGEQSSIHPYQNPQPALRLGPLSDSSTSGGTTGSPSLFPHTKNRCSQICFQLSTHPLPPSGQENLQPCVLVEKLTETRQEEEVALRKRKRKLHHCDPDMSPACVEEEKEDEVVPTSRRSPPSWLFERQEEASGADVGSGPKQTRSPEEAVSTTVHYSAVHGDGTPFSYAYKPAGQLLLDLSRFKVPDSTLQWAAKYLKSDG